MSSLLAVIWNLRMVDPVVESARIQSLDVLRGFALLGILLLNIIGFGFASAAYTSPRLTITNTADFFAWAIVELTAEGAMRAIFSMLFGAGVLLFLGRDDAGRGVLHYKRTIWLLIFGLIDGYLLMWTGDILVCYALAGFVLYFFRNASSKRLAIASVIGVILLTLFNTGAYMSLNAAESAADYATQLEAKGEVAHEELIAARNVWEDFRAEVAPDQAALEEELALRRTSLATAMTWAFEHMTHQLLSNLPTILFWDAIVLMIIGMALYRYGFLQGQCSRSVYVRTAVVGFFIGIVVNLYEIYSAFSADFALLPAFNLLQPTYHIGRIGMAFGWMSLIILVLVQTSFGQRLASVGRMALTNYLMHSLICMLVFTGAGLGLIGSLGRAEIYGVVLAIWIFQLWFSPWWLKRYYYGPVEWLWRLLTYGRAPKQLKNLA